MCENLSKTRNCPSQAKNINPPQYIQRNSVFIREGDIFHKLNIGINYKLNVCIGMNRSSYKIPI